MTWPADPLDIRVRIALDGPDRTTDPSTWTWVDISEYGREAPQIVIGQGDADEWGETPPATCRLTLDNSDGRFSRRNAAGPYYGRFGRSTPIEVSVDPDGEGWVTRFFGEVASWPKRWDITGADAIVPIECAGVSRRLGQNEQPIDSALTGYLASTSPVAWWPLEDGVDSTRAAPGLPSGLPMSARSGVVDFTDNAPPGAAGSARLAPSAINQMRGSIAGAASAAWQVGILTRQVLADELPAVPGYAYWVPLEIRTTTGAIWRVVQQTHDDDLSGLAAVGVALYASEDATSPDEFVFWDAEAAGEPGPLYGVGEGWRTIQWTAEQSGSDAEVALYMDGVLLDSDTWTGVTIGAPVSATTVGAFAGGADGGISAGMDELHVGAIAIHDGASLVDMHAAAQGYVSESASARITRLCDQAGIPASILGSSDTELMGVQVTGTLMRLLRECEASDGGTLMDDPTGPGLLYVPRAERYNLTAAALAVGDGDVGDAPEAADDDLGSANSVTAARVDGSSYTARDEDDITDSGVVVPDAVTLSLASDAQLGNQAGWRLHLASVDEDRWPRISINLAARPELIPWWIGVTPGVTRIRIVDPPSQVGVEPIDVIVEGWQETISQVEWRADLYCVPASPWTVAVREDPDLARRNTAGSELAVAAGTGDTTLLVATTVGPVWTQDSAAYSTPMGLAVGGERVDVSQVRGSVQDDFNRTGSSGWGTPDYTYTGGAWTVEGTAGDWSVGSGVGSISTATINSIYLAHCDVGSTDHRVRGRVTVPVVPTGAAITLRQTVRLTDSSNYYEVQVSLQPSTSVMIQLFKRVGGTLTSVSSNRPVPHAHFAGAQWWIDAQVQGDRLWAKAWPSTASEPGWLVDGTDNSLTTGMRAGPAVRRESSNTNGTTVITWGEWAVVTPQAMTVTRAVNGVVKAHSAGAPIRLWTPARRAM